MRPPGSQNETSCVSENHPQNKTTTASFAKPLQNETPEGFVNSLQIGSPLGLFMPFLNETLLNIFQTTPKLTTLPDSWCQK